MSSVKDRTSLKQLDKTFLDRLHVGDRLFHYPRKGDSAQSFELSPSAEYSMFSVIDLPTEDDVILMGAFDTGERRQHHTRAELLSGDWWHMMES